MPLKGGTIKEENQYRGNPVKKRNSKGKVWKKGQLVKRKARNRGNAERKTSIWDY